MSNLLTVLPDFDVSGFAHLLPSLEKALVSTADLLTLDALDIAKRAQVPPAEVSRLAEALLERLHGDTGVAGSANGQDRVGRDVFARSERVRATRATISTLDDQIDAVLGGGVALGHLTEIVGESAAGKTQFLLTLLLSAQLARDGSKGNDANGRPTSALYVSTEAPLQTARLSQILTTHPKLAAERKWESEERPSLSRVHSTQIHDVEAQEHILRYQVPVAIQKHNVQLLVIDSIAANYRAEFEKGGGGGKNKKSAETIARRTMQLIQIGAHLRSLARTHNIAVVVANQVADRFAPIESMTFVPSQSTQSTRPGSPQQSIPAYQSVQPPGPPQQHLVVPSSSLLSTDDPLSLDHQQRFFTGWGDDISVTTNLKSPSLGLAWTNQLACRIALLKDPVYDERAALFPGEERNLVGWKRACKVVFSASAPDGFVPFEIWEGGVRGTAVREPDAAREQPS